VKAEKSINQFTCDAMLNELGRNSTVLIKDLYKTMDPADLNSYVNIFHDKNLVVHTFTKELENSTRWPVLSVHCAFEGHEYYQSRNRTYAVTNSNYLILNEGTIRSGFISSAKVVESFTVNFSPFFLKSYLSSLAKSGGKMDEDSYHTDFESLQFTEQLYEHDLLVSPQLFKIRYLLSNWDCNKGQIEETMFALMESMVLNQRKIWGVMSNMDCAKASTQKELYERLTRTKDYISSCFKENISIEDLSKLACLNQHYFLREFKKMFGFSPHGYIQRLRLKEARRLLKTTDKMTIEICHEVGYNDPSSFCKLFKKEFNCSPLDYRLANPSYSRMAM